MTVLDHRSVVATDSDLPTPRGHWLLWANYLAMSWTWCIGMFLPVLLVRDYGIWGWVVFAVPNVIGAAALGWVPRSRAKSWRVLNSHHAATIVFSAVTSAFQIFAAGYAFNEPWMIISVIAIAAVAFGITSRGDRGALILAAITLGVSVVCMVIAIRHWPGSRPPSPGVDSWQTDLLPLTLVCLFGFLLCPHLDLTLGYARLRLRDEDSPIAFAVGFGGFFLAMICFSLYYAMVRVLDPLKIWALTVYFSVQLGLTTGLHWSIPTRLGLRVHSWMLPVATIVVGVMCYWLASQAPVPNLLSAREGTESIYRLFMGFYGLVFPAYVWLCMIPSPSAKPSRRSLVVFAISVLVATPMFFMGFILGKMIWLLPGLATVLLARLFVPRVRAVHSNGADSAASDAAR